jgi:hypothetical protein
VNRKYLAVDLPVRVSVARRSGGASLSSGHAREDGTGSHRPGGRGRGRGRVSLLLLSGLASASLTRSSNLVSIDVGSEVLESMGVDDSFLGIGLGQLKALSVRVGEMSNGSGTRDGRDVPHPVEEVGGKVVRYRLRKETVVSRVDVMGERGRRD